MSEGYLRSRFFAAPAVKATLRAPSGAPPLSHPAIVHMACVFWYGASAAPTGVPCRSRAKLVPAVAFSLWSKKQAAGTSEGLRFKH